MQTLVIYDNSGFILSQAQGSNLREPVGVPFLILNETPTGKYLTRIDVSKTPHTPVYEDMPNPNATMEQQISNLKVQLEAAKSENLNNLLILMKALAEVYEKFISLQIGGTL